MSILNVKKRDGTTYDDEVSMDRDLITTVLVLVLKSTTMVFTHLTYWSMPASARFLR